MREEVCMPLQISQGLMVITTSAVILEAVTLHNFSLKII
jgi:hypothetical protein